MVRAFVVVASVFVGDTKALLDVLIVDVVDAALFVDFFTLVF